MAYNESLASRVRDALASRSDVEEKKMMGGLIFMVDGKMCLGVLGDELMIRYDPEMKAALMKEKGVRDTIFNDKPTRGLLFVSLKNLDSEKDFKRWIKYALDFNPKATASKKKPIAKKPTKKKSRS